VGSFYDKDDGKMTFDIGDNVRVVCKEDNAVIWGKIIYIDESKQKVIVYDNKKTIRNRRYKSIGYSNQKVLSIEAKHEFIKYINEKYTGLLKK